MNSVQRELRFEWSHPAYVREVAAERPIIYLPLGSYEWHGEHLPLGLDALKAHDLCLHAARQTGGLVCPPLFYGTGGEHAAYPWTIMIEDAQVLTVLLRTTLTRLQACGMRLAVIFTGHYAREQVQMLAELAEAWRREANPMQVLSLNDSMLPDSPIPPDHAGLFETSLMGALAPEALRLDLLPARANSLASRDESPSPSLSPHDPGNPLFGIFGADPRDYDPEQGHGLLNLLVAWLAGQVERAWKEIMEQDGA